MLLSTIRFPSLERIALAITTVTSCIAGYFAYQRTYKSEISADKLRPLGLRIAAATPLIESSKTPTVAKDLFKLGKAKYDQVSDTVLNPSADGIILEELLEQAQIALDKAIALAIMKHDPNNPEDKKILDEHEGFIKYVLD